MLLKSHQSRALIGALSLASVVVYINLYIMQGMLPLIAQQFHVSPGQSTLLLSATVFSLALALLLVAALSDRYGRYQLIVASLVLLSLSNPLLVYAGNFEQLMGLRLLQGAILAVIPACAMAYFRDELSSQWLLTAGAFYIGANSVGGIVGRLLGGLVAQYLSWQQAMWALTLLTLLATLAVLLLLPKPVAGLQQTESGKLRQVLNGFASHLKDPGLRLAYVMGGLAFMVMVNQFSFIQLHLMQAPYQLGRFEATLIFLCYLSGTWVSFKSARVIARKGIYRLWYIASLAMLGGSLLTLMDSLPFIVAGFLITAWGFFLTHACCNTYVAQRARHHRAKATALYLCSYYLGAALGGPYLMPFWQHAGWPGVVLGSVVIIALLMLWLWQAKRGGLMQGDLLPGNQ
ncbi:MFS transporter [Shewanella sp. GXUN23E]|uniref:MFS transporter n=1 Tax=Shewanella sp. GXUN23E TaxID=3422498 RepID=UPI003D7D4BC2